MTTTERRRVTGTLLAILVVLPLLSADDLPAENCAAPQGASLEDRRFLHQLERGPGADVSRGALSSTDATSEISLAGGTGCPHSFDALHYALDLEIDPVAKEIAGHADVIALAVAPLLASLTLDLDDTLTVDSVRVDGAPASFSRPADAVTITFPGAVPMGDSVTVRIYYHGPGANEGGGGFGGFWWNFQVAFSMGVGLNADPPSMGRSWFPCFDEPCDKATVEAWFTVPTGRKAVSNGLLLGTIDNPDGTTTYHWRHLYPISTYLIAVAVAIYEELPDAHYPFVSYFVYPNLVTRAQQSFSHVYRMMDCYIANFGPYPFDKFCYMTASKGDMEHQTCVTHLASLVNGFHTYDNIVAHELSHQWWGDGVTVSDWRDVWLSEGFATWCEAVYFGWRDGPAQYAAYMTGFMQAYIASGETTPIHDPDPMWGSTTYEKGAAVVHMLRHVLGDSVFFDALRTHWNDHAYGNHTSADFQASMEAVSGRDLDWFFDSWLYQPGYPRYQWSWWSVPLAGGSHRVTVTVDQVQTTGGLFTMPIDLRIQTVAGDTTVVLFADQDPDYAQFTVGAVPTDVVFDPGDHVLDVATEVAPTGTGVAGDEPAGPGPSPAGLRLLPNPSRDITRLEIMLTTPQTITLEIVDLAGRRVNLLHTGPASAGLHRWTWNGCDLHGSPTAPGVYLARLHSGITIHVQKMLRID